MKVVLLIISLVGLALQSFGQQEQSKIDRKQLKSFVRVLTSDSLEGRGTGTVGHQRAQKIISDRFKQLGLTTYDQNGYLEKFTLHQTYWGQVYIKSPNRVLKNFENMVFQGSDVLNDEVEKGIVFGGSGTEEELNQIEVKDRFVLVFVKNLRAHYDINTRLAKRKAAGIILANPENQIQFETIKNTLKDYSLEKRLSFSNSDKLSYPIPELDTIKFINTITIPNSEIKSISGLSQGELIRIMNEMRIKDVPITKVKVRFERIKDEIETANIFGIVKGKSNKTIIISAHYDHLGKSGKEYFPGADDNASGVAALLEIAEEFSISKDLEYNIAFLATSGEEAGLLGSLYHVSKPDFDPQSILCNLNLDMISRIDDKHSNKKYLYCIGSDQSIEFDNLIKKADSLYNRCSFDFSLNNSKEPLGLFTRSDNYNFYKKGIPSILFFSGSHLDYHTRTDTLGKIDFENLENRVRQISVVIELLQSEGLKN